MKQLNKHARKAIYNLCICAAIVATVFIALALISGIDYLIKSFC